MKCTFLLLYAQQITYNKDGQKILSMFFLIQFSISQVKKGKVQYE